MDASGKNIFPQEGSLPENDDFEPIDNFETTPLDIRKVRFKIEDVNDEEKNEQTLWTEYLNDEKYDLLEQRDIPRRFELDFKPTKTNIHYLISRGYKFNKSNKYSGFLFRLFTQDIELCNTFCFEYMCLDQGEITVRNFINLIVNYIKEELTTEQLIFLYNY